MIKKHKAFFTVLCVIAALIIYLAANLIWSNNALTYNYYTVKTDKIKNSIMFVAVSDSEGKEFGTDNTRLIEKIKEADPEFVLILGDMVDNESKDTGSMTNLCRGLAGKYPVYCTLGNHEDNRYTVKGDKTYSDYKTEVENTGAKLLINEMEDYTSQKGDRITIAGLRTFPFFEYDAPQYNNDENRLFSRYLYQEDEKHFSVLMCHYPEASFWGLDKYNIDLMVSGHTHGGLIRLPFFGGLYAPEQGLFPEYDKGYYKTGNMEMIISAGLGTASGIPRFNNPPDITVITLKSTVK